jgi:hypothetical protein
MGMTSGPGVALAAVSNVDPTGPTVGRVTDWQVTGFAAAIAALVQPLVAKADHVTMAGEPALTVWTLEVDVVKTA